MELLFKLLLLFLLRSGMVFGGVNVPLLPGLVSRITGGLVLGRTFGVGLTLVSGRTSVSRTGGIVLRSGRTLLFG
jgi:hypothetical protein